MSVIFKTLRKLRNPPPNEGKDKYGLKKHGNVYSFGKILLSQEGLFAAALLVIVVGFLIVFASRFFVNDISQNGKMEVSVKERSEKPPKDRAPKASAFGASEDNIAQGQDRGQEDANKEVPEEPAKIPTEQVEPGRLYLPSADRNNASRQRVFKARYIRPLAREGQDKPPGTVRYAAEQGERGHKALVAGNSPASGSTAFPTLEEEGEREVHFADSLAPNANSFALNPRSCEITFDGKQVPNSTGTSREKQRKLVNITPHMTERASDLDRKNGQRTAKIARLVSKVEGCLEGGRDIDQARELIVQLAELKGDKSSYVLKLKAVWHMYRKEYSEAAHLLRNVLDKDNNDLEAGINLAVIDITKGRLEEARRRLIRLRDTYPADHRISELFYKIGP